MGDDGGLEKGEGWREGDGGTQVVARSHRSSSSQGCMCVYGACGSYRLALCNPPPIILFIVFHLLPNNSIRCMERKLDKQKCREMGLWCLETFWVCIFHCHF